MNDMKNFLGNAAGFRLFFNERDSDISIKVEHEREKWHFPAHKLVLCTMSEVFRTMLEVDMVEKNTKVITIRDSGPYTVKQFLKYLYMGVVDFNGWCEALNLLKIAHQYSVQALTNLCETYLVSNISFSNACLLYETARTYSLKTLKRDTRDFILQGGFIISATEGFFNLRSRSLESFISNPSFNVENEGSLLTSLREWAVCECSRKCVPLTKLNVLAAMEPFLKHIKWDLIPESQRTFVPNALVNKSRSEGLSFRKTFHVSSLMQYHMSYVKFVLELGMFYEQRICSDATLCCARFSIDNHAFLAGFRIVGLFRANMNYSASPYYLILSRDDGKVYVQFNLNSLPWTRGAPAANSVWREMIAYLPYPIRIDPFSPYVLSLKSDRPCKLIQSAKWPKTRLDTESIATNLGLVHFRSHNSTYGITQLFLLPAPPYRNICNRGFDE